MYALKVSLIFLEYFFKRPKIKQIAQLFNFFMCFTNVHL